MFLLHPPWKSNHSSHAYSFTFHYVSITSWNRKCIRKKTFIIYIPLCFYYIHIEAIRLRLPPHIYIPLCFYYIYFYPCNQICYTNHLHSTMFLLHQKRNLLFEEKEHPFTFHYVSITSIDCCRYSRGSGKFTFHYVSITSKYLLP